MSKMAVIIKAKDRTEKTADGEFIKQNIPL